MKQTGILLVFLFMLISSCTTTQHLNRRGVQRINKITFAHPDIPPSFNGFRIAFISDLHYKSALQKQGLDKLISQLQKIQADLLLLGGDYMGKCEEMEELFSELGKIESRYGTAAVFGNHDENQCPELIRSLMKQHGIQLLEHESEVLVKDSSRIIIAGVRNAFDLDKNGVSPSLSWNSEDFVILLVHTPDYAEQVPITGSDLVLSGHTHGGQVAFLGFAPKTSSHYGLKFRSGLKYNHTGIPVFITNGVGTSREHIRWGAPSEIVLITLKSLPTN